MATLTDPFGLMETVPHGTNGIGFKVPERRALPHFNACKLDISRSGRRGSALPLRLGYREVKSKARAKTPPLLMAKLATLPAEFVTKRMTN